MSAFFCNHWRWFLFFKSTFDTKRQAERLWFGTPNCMRYTRVIIIIYKQVWYMIHAYNMLCCGLYNVLSFITVVHKRKCSQNRHGHDDIMTLRIVRLLSPWVAFIRTVLYFLRSIECHKSKSSLAFVPFVIEWVQFHLSSISNLGLKCEHWPGYCTV